MTTTVLHPTALPGKPWSFSAKTEAIPEKGIGPFTALSIMALPGMIHSFNAKTEAEVVAVVDDYRGFLVNVGRMMG